jgi:lauroyl/myristoyl acyltransferase
MLGGIKEVAEYALALLLIRLFGMMPRSMARPAAQTLAWLGFHLARRQRRAGMRNLQIAFPFMTDSRITSKA